MKTKMMFMITCTILFISIHPYAFACGDCYRSCGESSCEKHYCTSPDNGCACTDPGWRWNNCISKRKFCEAFGNMGALDD